MHRCWLVRSVEGVSDTAKDRRPIDRLSPSDDVSSSELLAGYGLPDEARPLHRFEIPINEDPQRIDQMQLVRYGDRKFIFSADGQLQNMTPQEATFESGDDES